MPTAASVTLGGATVTVTDYFDLVYAGVHHNWDNQYWVLFDEPLAYAGHPVYGFWVDEQPSTFEIEGVYTHDAALARLDTLEVRSYVVEPVP